MRRVVTTVLTCFLSAAPLAAQFEGTIHMRLRDVDGKTDMPDVKMAMKGDLQSTIITLPASAGPMAGLEMRSIYDVKANTITMLMPMPPGMPMMAGMADAKGMKNVLDLSKASFSETDSKAEIKK